MNNLCYLDCSDKLCAIGAVIAGSSAFDRLCNDDAGCNREALKEAVISRERICSTAIGHGVIAAHGQLEGLSSVLAGLGVCTPGFMDSSGDMIRFVLVLASNPDRYDLYVRRLSELLSFLHDSFVREALIGGELDSPVVRRFLKALSNDSKGADDDECKA
ncbi:MAG: PTS sugar transporter subunit IIA [Sphaerochaetaceae bacterium]